MPQQYPQFRTGMLLGLGAYAIWGVLPLYFKLLAHVGAVEIVSHRIIWSLFFLAALAALWRKWPGIWAALTTPRLAMTLAVTALLIGVNWSVYIYAVVSGHVLEGSLGYYLNPLVNVLLGVFLLQEKLTNWQKFAFILACAGVAVLASGAGSALWISLTLAASFATYGYLRKVAPVDALEGLTVETLLLFTAAAKRLPYSTLGFLQYVAPTLQFLLAVLAFGEPFRLPHMICFGAIWVALAIFTVEGIRQGVRASAARREALRDEGPGTIVGQC